MYHLNKLLLQSAYRHTKHDDVRPHRLLFKSHTAPHKLYRPCAPCHAVLPLRGTVRERHSSADPAHDFNDLNWRRCPSSTRAAQWLAQLRRTDRKEERGSGRYQ
jgi:hypothetical protein